MDISSTENFPKFLNRRFVARYYEKLKREDSFKAYQIMNVCLGQMINTHNTRSKAMSSFQIFFYIHFQLN